MSCEITLKLGSEDAFYFRRGRAALFALLDSMDIRSGDEVIIQAFTCLAVPSPIINIGAEPTYVDINTNNLSFQVELLEEAISDKTKAIVVQHTFGIPAEMDKITRIADKHDLYLIEDCCHAICSKYQGKEVGTYGDAAFYSFEWGKPVTIGLGGAAIVNNESLLPRMDEYNESLETPSFLSRLKVQIEYFVHQTVVNPSTYWQMRSIYHYLSDIGLISGTFEDSELEGELSSDFNKKLTEVYKSRLKKKLSRFDEYVGKSEELVVNYKDILQSNGKPESELGYKTEPVYLHYPVLVDNKEEVLDKAKELKIEVTNIFNSPVHPLEGRQLEKVKYKATSCETAEEVSDKIIGLPIYEKVNQRHLPKIEELMQIASFSKR